MPDEYFLIAEHEYIGADPTGSKSYYYDSTLDVLSSYHEVHLVMLLPSENVLTVAFLELFVYFRSI
jgi:hypothetical protein